MCQLEKEIMITVMGFAHIVWHTAVATLSGNPYQNWLCTIHQANEPFLNLPLLFHIFALLCHKNHPTFYCFLVAQRTELIKSDLLKI